MTKPIGQKGDAKIAALRSAGLTENKIGEKLGYSRSAIHSSLKRTGTKKGEIVNQVKAELTKQVVKSLDDAGEVRAVMESLFNDSLQAAQRASCRLDEASQSFEPPKTIEGYLTLARAENAAATARRSNMESLSKLLTIASGYADPDKLPIRILKSMTEEDVQEERARQRTEAIEFGLTPSRDDEITIVVEGK